MRSASMTDIPIRVCAAVIRRSGSVLLATRPSGSHLEGMWEFPGGKVKDGESDEESLRREIKEELSVEVTVADLIFSNRFSYPGKEVELFFYRAFLLDEKTVIHPLEGQKLEWVRMDELSKYEFVPADLPFAEFLK